MILFDCPSQPAEEKVGWDHHLFLLPVFVHDLVVDAAAADCFDSWELVKMRRIVTWSYQCQLDSTRGQHRMISGRFSGRAVHGPVQTCHVSPVDCVLPAWMRIGHATEYGCGIGWRVQWEGDLKRECSPMQWWKERVPLMDAHYSPVQQYYHGIFERTLRRRMLYYGHDGRLGLQPHVDVGIVAYFEAVQTRPPSPSSNYAL
mmetsp:Transcript_28800/g.52117  ORF Transcript_28800/g.52117 Transcript_28800/m.52117 type:complete len:202 (+) Transcript_28800:818-1423(+)